METPAQKKAKISSGWDTYTRLGSTSIGRICKFLAIIMGNVVVGAMRCVARCVFVRTKTFEQSSISPLAGGNAHSCVRDGALLQTSPTFQIGCDQGRQFCRPLWNPETRIKGACLLPSWTTSQAHRFAVDHDQHFGCWMTTKMILEPGAAHGC